MWYDKRMRKFILLILFIGLLGYLFLLTPNSAEAICPAGYTSSPTIGGQTMCCRPIGISGCIWPDSPSVAGDECCHIDTGDGGGAGGDWWLTDVWLTVEQYNVMVDQPLSGSLRIETKQNISSPCVDFGDGEIEFFSACDGSDLADNPEADPLICEYDFVHSYAIPGTYTIIGSRWGCPSLLGANETITVSEEPVPPPGTEAPNPLEATTIEEVLEAIITIIYIVSGLAVLLIMIGGFYILTAAGNPEQIKRGRKIILYTIIGFAIMAISRGIIALIYLILGVTI